MTPVCSYCRNVIVWINGTFGVGKTTTAQAIAARTDWRTFDPEHVGFLLAGNMRDLAFDDFQDLPPWRTLIPVVAAEIFRFTRPPAMTAVQTVLVESYWEELNAGFEQTGSAGLSCRARLRRGRASPANRDRRDRKRGHGMASRPHRTISRGSFVAGRSRRPRAGHNEPHARVRSGNDR